MSPLAAEGILRGRKALAEFIGTAMLVAAIIGSGIAAQQLSPGATGLELLENSIATAGALAAIILAVGPVSGAHLNPLITLFDRLFRGMSTHDAATYIGAQFSGGFAGALLANAMFGRSLISLSTHHRSSGPHLLAEIVATFGLMVVVFGVVRSQRASMAPFAVASYIAAAYWFTSSTSFANPAVTLARMFSNTFAGIDPSSVAPFVVAEIIGATLGAGGIALLYPPARRAAQAVVVPHDAS